MRQAAVAVALSLLTCGLYVFARPDRSKWGERADAGFTPPASVRVDNGLVYARYGNRSMHLDLYRPAYLGRTPVPAVVVMRGGGFQHGDSKGFGFIAAHLAQAGFAAACIQYRTTRDALFPAPLQDAKAAVRWLRANAAAYRIDPDAVGAIGGSAGGYLAALLATTDGAADLEGDGGNRGVSSRVTAAVAMATPADFVDMSPYSRRAVDTIEGFIGSPLDRLADARRRASPATYVSRNSAPILLIHGDVDPDIPSGQALLLLRRYQEAGAHAELLMIPGAPHDPYNYTRWFGEVMDRSVGFLRHAFEQTPESMKAFEVP